MFTGIVEDTGVVESIRSGSGGGGIQRYRFAPDNLPCGDLQLGESVAIDGCCLTVVAFDDRSFEVDASPETLDKTTLGDRPVQARVNLERALALGDRLGGHLVTGHVDTTGTYRSSTPAGDGAIVEIGFPGHLAAHLVDKGSVAVDGVSLTVNTVEGDAFTVFVIPHTLQITTLGARRPGDRVNLETDLLGKYVLRALSLRGTLPSPGADQGPPAAAGSGVSDAFLRAHGWL